MSTIIEAPRKRGRKPSDKKNVKICVLLSPEIIQKIEEDIDDGFGNSKSGTITQILKRHYNGKTKTSKICLR